VQTLAGVLLPSATVLLLLLCNDEAVLGPWVNGRWLNLFTGVVIMGLLLLSIILTTSVLYPGFSDHAIVLTLAGGGIVGLLAVVAMFVAGKEKVATVDLSRRPTWRMPPLSTLSPAPMRPATRMWMFLLRGYLIVAGGLIVVRILALASQHPFQD
jgi:hypothetical protein